MDIATEFAKWLEGLHKEPGDTYLTFTDRQWPVYTKLADQFCAQHHFSRYEVTHALQEGVREYLRDDFREVDLF